LLILPLKKVIKVIIFLAVKMIKALKIFFSYNKNNFKIVLSTRPFALVLFMLGKIIRFLFFFFLIIFIYKNVKIIKGFSFEQMMVFYLTFNLVDQISQILFREVYRFKDYLVSGDFNLILLKPHHPFLKVLLGGIDLIDILLLPFFFILVFIFLLKIPTFTLFNLFLYLIFLLNSLIISFAFHILVLAIGIMTIDTDNLIMFYRDLNNLSRFPIEIYKTPIREILTFVIPIAIASNFPAKIFFNLLSKEMIVYSFIFSFFFLMLSLKIWDIALKKYQSWGG